MKKIFSAVFIAVTALLIFSCLDAIEEPYIEPRIEGGNGAPFTKNNEKLNGFETGRANGYKDRDNEQRVTVELWILEGEIVAVNIDTSYETDGYGREIGQKGLVSKYMVDHNTITDIPFDTLTSPTPFGGRSHVSFNAVLEAAQDALEKIGVNHRKFEGGGRLIGEKDKDDYTGSKDNWDSTSPWTYHGRAISAVSDPIRFAGWMPHNASNRTTLRNTLTLTLENGRITRLNWGAVTASTGTGAENTNNDWDCRLYGRPALSRIRDQVVLRNSYDVGNLRIQNKSKITLPFLQYTNELAYNAGEAGELVDAVTAATGTIEQASAAVKEAFLNAVMKFARDPANQ